MGGLVRSASMEHISSILIEFGPWGMFIAALLSGTILPFSSEVVMVGLLAVGVSPWTLLCAASVGNVIGGITCYYIGRATTPKRIQQIFGIKPQNMERARRLIERWGIWIGFFCWIAVLGDAILVTLGIMRSNASLTLITMAIGKTVRYLVVLLSAMSIGSLFFS